MIFAAILKCESASGASDNSQQPFEFTLEEFYVYRTLVKDIGILKPEQVGDTIRVYRYLYLTMHLIRGLGKDPYKPVVTIEGIR